MSSSSKFNSSSVATTTSPWRLALSSKLAELLLTSACTQAQGPADLSRGPTSSASLAVKPDMPLLLDSSSSASGRALRLSKSPANDSGLPRIFLQSPQAPGGGTLRRSGRMQDAKQQRWFSCRQFKQKKHAQLLAMPSSLALILSSLCGTGRTVQPIPGRRFLYIPVEPVFGLRCQLLLLPVDDIPPIWLLKTANEGTPSETSSERCQNRRISTFPGRLGICPASLEGVRAEALAEIRAGSLPLLSSPRLSSPPLLSSSLPASATSTMFLTSSRSRGVSHSSRGHRPLTLPRGMQATASEPQAPLPRRSWGRMLFVSIRWSSKLRSG